MSASRTQSTLQNLPMELILAVMRCLPDYRSLLSLLQSSRVFLDVFAAAEPQILKAILSQLLHPKPVPEALNVRLQILSHRKGRMQVSAERDACLKSESQFPNLPTTRAVMIIPISVAAAAAAAAAAGEGGGSSAAPLGPPAQRWISGT